MCFTLIWIAYSFVSFSLSLLPFSFYFLLNSEVSENCFWIQFCISFIFPFCLICPFFFLRFFFSFFPSFFPFFPTCQVRVVRFYHSCSPPPPRLAILLLLLLLLLRQHLLHHLCLHFHVHCCLANSSPSSSPTSELSVHRWTSTWDLPSSVCTAGPQPGTFPAQCALLDLNLGPSQLSVHRWTSTAR